MPQTPPSSKKPWRSCCEEGTGGAHKKVVRQAFDRWLHRGTVRMISSRRPPRLPPAPIRRYTEDRDSPRAFEPRTTPRGCPMKRKGGMTHESSGIRSNQEAACREG